MKKVVGSIYGKGYFKRVLARSRKDLKAWHRHCLKTKVDVRYDDRDDPALERDYCNGCTTPNECRTACGSRF